MSKDIELRHILPNGHHRSSSSSDKMSGSGSFRSSPPHDIATDTVSAVPPVYSTVPEAQADHSRYNAQQVKNAHAVPQTEYTSPVGLDQPNEYDMIPDNNKRRDNRSLSPGVAPLMAENVLYGAPADEKLRHQSLKIKSEQQQQRRFTGSLSSQVVKEPADGGGVCTGRCCGVCLMLVLVFVVAFLAVAALVLVLSIMFQIYPVCDCTTTTQEFQALQRQVDELLRNMPTQAPGETPTNGMGDSMSLIERVDTLDSRLETLRNDLDTNVSSIKDGSVFADKNFSSVGGINFFETCQTTIESNCTITPETMPPGARPLPCTTPEVSVYKDGKYTLEMRCVRSAETRAASFPLVGILNFANSSTDERIAECQCYVVVEDNVNNPLVHSVSCGIQVTRCSSSQMLNTQLQLVDP